MIDALLAVDDVSYLSQDLFDIEGFFTPEDFSLCHPELAVNAVQ
jgi:hypothetical protein